MYREKVEELIKWKKGRVRKPLILQGAKKVGKTYLMKDFAKNNYKNIIYINLNPETQKTEIEEKLFKVLNQEKEIETIKIKIEEIINQEIEKDETVILLDELEKSQNARKILINMTQEEYICDIIGTISNWGITLKEAELIKPKVNIVRIMPLNFYEFLLASGEEELVNSLKEKNEEKIKELNAKYKNELKKYIYIGGMPGIVENFLKNKNYPDVRKAQNELIEEYEEQLEKAPTSVRENIIKIWDELPLYIIREDKVLRYGDLRDGSNATEYEPSIRYLEDMGLIYKVSRVDNIQFPISVYQDTTSFKLYYFDIGILSAKLNIPLSIILEEGKIFKIGNEALSEQFVLQELKSKLDMNIYFFKIENSLYETNFIIQYKGKVYPMRIEIQKNVRDNTLIYLRKNFLANSCVHITPNTYKWHGWLTDIPLYMVENMPPYENRGEL